MSENLIIPEHLAQERQSQLDKQAAPEIMRRQQQALAEHMAQQRHLRLQAIAHEYFLQSGLKPHECILIERHFYDQGTFRIEWSIEPKKNAKPSPDHEQTLPMAPEPNTPDTTA